MLESVFQVTDGPLAQASLFAKLRLSQSPGVSVPPQSFAERHDSVHGVDALGLRGLYQLATADCRGWAP
jgi:hypothetical protein